MRILVTGSSGHLGEALMRTLQPLRHAVTGIDTVGGPFTTHLGSIVDRDFVRRAMAGIEAVLHAATCTSRMWRRMRELSRCSPPAKRFAVRWRG